MNINLETQLSTQKAANTDINITTTYQPHTSIDEVQKSGYTLDIADKVTDNEAYQGQGLAAQEFMQQAGNLNTRAQKDFMIVMSGFVSGEDLQKMQEEGFNPGSVDVETYVSIVDEIKVTLAKSGVEIAGYNDNLDADMVKEVTGSQLDANELSSNLPNLLEERDLPVTEENIAELKDAAAQAADITELSDDAIKYMVTNQKAPTIENIYKAQFSSVSDIRQAQGYYSEGAGSYGKYYSKKADSINWDNLKGQIETIVKQAGLDTDAQTKAAAVENAKWLVESGIELNAKNLTLMSDLKSIKLPMAADKIYELCADAMGNGKAPTAALMTGEYPIAGQAQSIIDTVEGISDEAVHDAVESGVKINIKNLAAAQRRIDESAIHQTQAQEPSLKELEARRQLEEIRLMMSVEANKQLIRKGISIDTTELSRLVEELKAAEQNIRAAMFKGETAEENDIRAAVYHETLTKTKELGGMPAALAAKVATATKAYTIVTLHSEGKALQELQEAAENQSNQEGSDGGRQQKNAAAAYETLMTTPRKDLGDEISKAFKNVDDILDDMGIEATDANRRAVRILGYNTMEITEENINVVKTADSKVCGVIGRMTPAVTLKMIREQKNPLEMTLDELDDYLNEQDKDLISDAERFSKFLQKLDRSNAITKDEREAYIGVYRMLRQIEKTDGAVIGSIVMTGAEMNFKNMLSAIRSSASRNMNLKIDDSFGGLEAMITKGKAIDTQIMTGFNSSDGDSGNAHGNNKNAEAQEKYYARLSGEINDELANRTDVDKLRTVSITADTTIEAFANSLKMTQMSENSAELKEQQAQALKDFQQDMQSARQVEDDIVQTLIDYGQPVSINNIHAAEMLIADRGSLFRQIFGRAGKSSSDSSTEALDEKALEVPVSSEKEASDMSDRFVERLTDRENAQEGYRELVSEAKRAVENMVNRSAAQLDIKAAQQLFKGLSLAGSLAREENYEVPVNIKGEITSINLKIYRSATKVGKVAVTLETEQLGKVAAEFDVRQGKISGMMVYENALQDDMLRELGQKIEEKLQSDDTRVHIDLIHSKAVDLNRFGRGRNILQNDDKVSTSELYRTAKAFITAIKGL